MVVKAARQTGRRKQSSGRRYRGPPAFMAAANSGGAALHEQPRSSVIRSAQSRAKVVGPPAWQ